MPKETNADDTGMNYMGGEPSGTRSQLVSSKQEIQELKEMQRSIQSQLETMQETFLKKFNQLEEKEKQRQRSVSTGKQTDN